MFVIKCFLACFALSIATEQCEEQPSFIVSFGRTGSGKSWIGNKLTKPNTFLEGDSLESTTTAIQTALSWNGKDLMCDVPGYSYPYKMRSHLKEML